MPDLAPATLFQKVGLVTDFDSATGFGLPESDERNRTKPKDGISMTTRDVPALDSEAKIRVHDEASTIPGMSFRKTR